MDITIQKIADQAGLSTASISRILNGKGAHKPETIARVKRVVKTLSNRSQNSKDPKCVGIVLLAYPFFLSTAHTSSMLSAILEVLTAEGMLAQIIPINASMFTIDNLAQIVERFDLRGLLFQELALLDQMTEDINKLFIPVVRIGEVRQKSYRYIVQCDNRRLGENAAAYLWNLGFRNFGIIFLDNGDWGQKKRREGFVSRIQRLGGDANNIWISPISDVSLESTITSVEDFLKQKERPAALFFAQGGITQSFLNQLHRYGILVPQELFILAVEDAGELSVAELPIATISFPCRDMGTKAATMLVDLIRHGTTEENRWVRCESSILVGPACLNLAHPISKKII